MVKCMSSLSPKPWAVPVCAQQLLPALPPISEQAGLWLAAPLRYSVLPKNMAKAQDPKLTIKSERWSEPELNPLVSESEGLLERESRREREFLSDGVENFSGRSDPMGSKGRKPSGGFPRTFPRGLFSMLRTATERNRVCQGCSTTQLPPPGSCGPEATRLLPAHNVMSGRWHLWCLPSAGPWCCTEPRAAWCGRQTKVGYERLTRRTHFIWEKFRDPKSQIMEFRSALLEQCPLPSPCPSLPLVLEQAGAQGDSSPGMGAHISGRHTGSTSRNSQAQRWDTALIIPARSWLWAARKVPAWAADKGFAVPGVCSQQVCLIRPLPQSLQTRMCQTASLTLQVFLPLRRIQKMPPYKESCF